MVIRTYHQIRQYFTQCQQMMTLTKVLGLVQKFSFTRRTDKVKCCNSRFNRYTGLRKLSHFCRHSNIQRDGSSIQLLDFLKASKNHQQCGPDFPLDRQRIASISNCSSCPVYIPDSIAKSMLVFYPSFYIHQPSTSTLNKYFAPIMHHKLMI